MKPNVIDTSKLTKAERIEAFKMPKNIKLKKDKDKWKHDTRKEIILTHFPSEVIL